jgi:predicted enzyme related to lactoylglutathione lyase
MNVIPNKKFLLKNVFILSIVLVQPFSIYIFASELPKKDLGVAVGPQYDSTHVYIAPSDMDTFVNSFVATFGGQPSKPSVTNVLPVYSSTKFRYVISPVGMLSVFAYTTPIPYPFGQERYGYLVSDMDEAIKEARAAGAEVIVEPFNDPIGRDAVIQWKDGVKTQLYWHNTPPSYAPLKTIPDNRIYISPDRADEFVSNFIRFSHGKVIEDNKKANGAEIGRPNYIFRQIRIESPFGKMQIMVTDGHLPYPFGYDITGYQVDNLNDTLAKATNAGAKILSKPYDAGDRNTAILQFPGGYIAEVHDLKKAN